MARAPKGLNVKFQVSGVDELRSKLTELTDRAFSDSVLEMALEDGAGLIRNRAARLAPVGLEAVTRKRLREGIVVRAWDERKGVWRTVAPLREVAHANLQELGTKKHGAQPFMRPAFDQEKVRAVGIVRRQMKQAVDGVVR